MGKQTLVGHKQNLVGTRTQEKGAVTPQETEPDLPVSVQESPASYASRGIGQWWPATGLGTLSAAVCAWILFQGVSIIFMTSMIVWSQVSCQTAGKEHSPTHQQKIGLKTY